MVREQIPDAMGRVLGETSSMGQLLWMPLTGPRALVGRALVSGPTETISLSCAICSYPTLQNILLLPNEGISEAPGASESILVDGVFVDCHSGAFDHQSAMDPSLMDYQSRDTSIATVDSNGLVICQAAGQTQVDVFSPIERDFCDTLCTVTGTQTVGPAVCPVWVMDVDIASPADNSMFCTGDSISVSGTVSGTQTVSVNGTPASVNGNSWTATISLADGSTSRSIIATAISSDGQHAVVDSIGVKVQARPTSIASTTPFGNPLNYGSDYAHAMTSSSGNVSDLDGVVVKEIVTLATNPFQPLGNQFPIEGMAPLNSQRQLGDTIMTPTQVVDVNNFLPSPPGSGLPQTLSTPQELLWRCDAANSPRKDEFISFTEVAVTFTLFEESPGVFKGRTTSNGKSVTEPYSGPPLSP